MTDSCKEEDVKNCQDTASGLRGMMLQRVSSITGMKIQGKEKTCAEHINTEETGHQFGLGIFYFFRL